MKNEKEELEKKVLWMTKQKIPIGWKLYQAKRINTSEIDKREQSCLTNEQKVQ